MRLAVRDVIAGVVAAGLVLAATTPASAHNYIVESTPVEGEVLTALPETWSITTNDTLLYVGNDAVFGLWARDAAGLYYGDGCVDVSGPGMTATPAIGEPGAYTLVYSLVSADGHPLSGEIPFEWRPASDAPAGDAATGSAEPAHCGTAAPAPEGGGAGVPGDVWWIAGAVLAVGIAVIVSVVLTRRGRRGAAG